MPGDGKFLIVDNLRVEIPLAVDSIHPVRGVGFALEKGETLGIVGESGCGKSLTSLAIMGLLPKRAIRTADRLELDGLDLLSLSDKQLASQIRGNRISMIFQEPMTALNPILTVGDQITEVLFEHQEISKRDARARAIDVLREVGIPSPEKRIKQYPHELSGGMRQRVMIAMGLVAQPKVMIADEPTTALDVTIEAQILDLLDTLKREFKTSILFVTHDLNVVADIADDVIVMYAGEIVERGSVLDVFEKPKHPYTRGLLEAMPTLSGTTGDLPTIPGVVPSIATRPAGCRFHNRCAFVHDRCRSESPAVHRVDEQDVRCHLFDPAITREPE